MCGIVGFQGQFLHSSLIRGLKEIGHRGPDDHGRFFEETSGIGLGHARLSIIDLSPLGHQPMADPGTGVQLIFNGETYNYREL
jgi:asparagine synthase (glutamine-hydrolysing)